MGSIIGGLIGNIASSDDRDASKSATLEALKQYQNLNIPTTQEQELALQQLVSQGQLTPEMLQTVLQGNSDYDNITTDPRLKDAQMTALAKLSKQGTEGLTAMDRQALDTITRENERSVEAKNQQILQDMAARGQGGSGAELALQMKSAQAGADRASQQGMSVAAQAQQRALEATMNSANLAGSARSQDYNEQAQAAQARDAIARFNAANQQQVAATNVGAKNQAQASNLTSKQNIANQNVNIANQQQQYNKGLIQQQFNNQLTKANGVAGQQNNVANMYNNQANQTAAMWSGVGKGVDQVGGALMTGGMSLGADAAIKKGTQMGGQAYSGNTMYAAHGGMVPGEPIVEGDHPINDIVDAKLSPGEIVIPNSIANSSDEVILDFLKAVKNMSHKGK